MTISHVSMCKVEINTIETKVGLLFSLSEHAKLIKANLTTVLQVHTFVTTGSVLDKDCSTATTKDDNK